MKKNITPRQMGKLRLVFFLLLVLAAANAYGQAPNISYSGPQVYITGKSITPLKPTNSGGAVSAGGYSISPVLPRGLNINASTGIINGTPILSRLATNYTITAVNGSGSRSAIVNLTVTLSQKPGISYTGPNVYTVGTNITPLTPKYTGGTVPATQTPVTIGTAADAGGIAIDAAGNVYVTEFDKRDILEIPASGAAPFTTKVGFQPAGIAFDAAGNMYVTDELNHAIKKFPAGGGAPVSIGSGFIVPFGIALDKFGNIFVSDYDTKTIVRMPPGGGAPITVASGFISPSSIAVDPAGYIYVVDNGQTIKKATGGGGVSTYYSGNPKSVATDAAGNFYYSDSQLQTITEVPAGGSPKFRIASGIQSVLMATDATGNLYTANSTAGNTNRVQVIPPGNYTISPALPAGLSFDNYNGVISGTPTAISHTANYTITANNTGGSSLATVNITATNSLGSDARLEAIVPYYGSLSPDFSPEITMYTAIEEERLSGILITVYKYNQAQTITVNGTAVTGEQFGVLLSIGANTVNITVTAQDGLATKTYTIVFGRGSSSTNLSSLKISGAALSPAFNFSTTSYTATVGNTVSSVTVTPHTGQATATVKVNGTAVASGTPSDPIALSVGPNIINTVVTAQDSITTETYTVTVTRAPSANANILQLKLSSGTLSPSFAQATVSYTASVANAVSSITVTPAASDAANAVIKVNGTVVASHTASGAIPLSVGSNTVTLVCTAQDGVTTKTYTITVTRASGSLNSVYQPVSVSQPVNDPRLADNIIVHQGLSPNGDGINDVLIIDGIGNYPDNKLAIMSRNGELVFEATGYDNSSSVFDGHSNKTGKLQQPGTYFYSLEYKTGDVIKHKTGFIVIKY